MKFDVVLGNPPYQSNNNKSNKLWPSFIEKSISLLSENGYLGLVTPISWLRGMGPDLARANELLLNQNLIYINKNVNKYFSSVGENIGWFLLSKNNYKGSTTIQDELDHTTINIRTYTNTDLQSTISKKVYGFSEKIETKNFLSYKSKDIEVGKCSLMRDNIYTTEVVHTGSQLLYYKPESVSNYNGWKVIVNMSGTYFSPKKDYIYKTLSSIPGRNVVGIYTNSKEEASMIEFILKSKLYRFVVTSNKTGGFNTGPFSRLPKFSKELMLCDSEMKLYNYFNLTEEEIQYIEDNVK